MAKHADGLLSQQQAAERIGCRPSDLDRWACLGMPCAATKPWGERGQIRRRFDEAAVRTWLDQHAARKRRRYG
jgi:hypothetical protein